MGKIERRNAMTLDEISGYLRRLRDGYEKPILHRVCNTIRTIDLALGGSAADLSQHLSTEAWARVRDEFFDILLTSFSGYFLVYPKDSAFPLEFRAEWPERGRLEFYPEKTNRKSDVFSGQLERIHPSIVLSFRIAYAEGRDRTAPDDFEYYYQYQQEEPQEESSAQDLLDRLQDICQEEALKSRKIAHRKWWHLYWESCSCPDRKQKNELKRQLRELQSIWGAPG